MHSRSALWFALGIALVSPIAHAQAVHTWGAPADTPPVPPASPEATQRSPALGPPPEAPPVTEGTPVEGSTAAAASPPSVAAVASEGAVAGTVASRYVLEGVEVRGNSKTLSRVVLRYVPYRPGDILDVNDKKLELTRFKLLGTGFFRDVQLSLRRGSRHGAVVLVVEVEERNTLILDQIWLGLSADVDSNGNARPLTAFGGAQATETNLAGTGIALGGAFAVADSQVALRLRLVDPQSFDGRWTTEAEALYNSARDFFGNGDVLVDDPTQPAQDFAVLQYRRVGGHIGFGHDLGLSSQLFFKYRLEKIDATLPLAASDYRGLDVEPIDFMVLPGSSFLSTLGATFVYDTRDEPVLPTRGQHLVADLDVSLTPLGSDYPYTKVVLRGSEWFPLPWGHVLGLDAFAGGVFGDAPLFERFYVGDFSDLLPDRVLGLVFDRRPSPNFLGTDIVENRYGNYAAQIDAEYRVPLYRGYRSIYGIDAFASFGVYGLANEEDFTQVARGYTGFSAVPIDLTFNAGLRIDTEAGGFVIGVANLVGLIPVRGTDQGAARP